MKKITTIKYLLGAIMLGSVITACDKFEDDVPPARMAGLSLNDDHYTTVKNKRVALHVLINDTVGSAATVQFSQPPQGTLQPDSVGTMYYYPAPNFVGTDAFTYKACLDNNCAIANVTITVNNDSTIVSCVKAIDDFRNVAGRSVDTISVLKNDILCGISPNNTVVTITKQPAHGQAFISMTNKIDYVPNLNYIGTDELTYTISNSQGHSSAKVRFNVVTPPCRITARTDSAYINRVLGTIDTVSVKIVANDIICPGNGPITVSLQGQSQKQTQYGLFQVVGTGSNTRLIYTTTAGNNFTDFVLYNICQAGICHSAYVYVKVR